VDNGSTFSTTVSPLNGIRGQARLQHIVKLDLDRKTAAESRVS